MIEYISLLRGINVGGHRKISMSELKEVLTSLGLKNVKTYIQSGNMVFHSKEKNTTKLEQIIEETIKIHFGHDVPTLVKTKLQFKTIFEACPFYEDQKKSSYFVLLKDEPTKEQIILASEKSYPYDSFIVTKQCIYLYPEKGYGQSKFNLSYFEKVLNTQATARNYNTMLKLLSLCEN